MNLTILLLLFSNVEKPSAAFKFISSIGHLKTIVKQINNIK